MSDSVTAQTMNSTFTSHGERCAGTLYLPERSDGKPPVIIMAHGFCAQRDFRLPAFAERFVAEGLACFIFDYRNFGDSTGEPRHWVSPRRHQQDWRRALDHVRELRDIDPDRIILWGTSYSGGHVLQIASQHPPIIGVIAQVPFVSGMSMTAATPIARSLKLTVVAIRDLVGSIFGRPHYSPTVGHPNEFAAMNTPESWDGWHAIMPTDTDWENKVLSRAFLTLPLFNPIRVVDKISVPALVVASKQDSVTPWRLAKMAADKIPNSSFKSLETNHFGPYVGRDFETNIATQIQFLRTLLAR